MPRPNNDPQPRKHVQGIVKNPSKRSVCLKNGLEEKKSEIQCHKISKAEYIRRVEDEKSSLQLTYVMNLGTFCPLEKNWHIVTPIVGRPFL
jgi:hypothetical protein